MTPDDLKRIANTSGFGSGQAARDRLADEASCLAALPDPGKVAPIFARTGDCGGLLVPLASFRNSGEDGKDWGLYHNGTDDLSGALGWDAKYDAQCIANIGLPHPQPQPRRRPMIQLFDQTTFSDRAAGTHGDCCRACVATILQIDPRNFPHPIKPGGDDRGEWNPDFRNTLRALKVSLRSFEYGPDEDMRNPDLQDPDWGGAVIPRIVMAAGPSPRGPWLHAVVWDRYAGRMVHDPHPSRAGLIEVRALDYLAHLPRP